MEERFEESKKDYNDRQTELARFQDSNMGLTTASARTKLSRLQDEVRLSYSIYSELALQLEKAKIAEKEVSPLLTTIDPVVIPIKKAYPKRLKILVISTLLGGLIAVSLVMLYPAIGEEAKNKNIKARLKSKKESA